MRRVSRFSHIKHPLTGDVKWTTALVAICTALLVARLVAIALFDDPDPDAWGHYKIARSVLAHPMRIDLHWVWLPGYHFLLAGLIGLGASFDAIRAGSGFAGDFTTRNFPVGFAYASAVAGNLYRLSLGGSLVQWIFDGDGFWDEAAKWSGGAVPVAGDDVQIIDYHAGNGGWFKLSIPGPNGWVKKSRVELEDTDPDEPGVNFCFYGPLGYICVNK